MKCKTPFAYLLNLYIFNAAKHYNSRFCIHFKRFVDVHSLLYDFVEDVVHWSLPSARVASSAGILSETHTAHLIALARVNFMSLGMSHLSSVRSVDVR